MRVQCLMIKGKQGSLCPHKKGQYPSEHKSIASVSFSSESLLQSTYSTTLHYLSCI